MQHPVLSARRAPNSKPNITSRAICRVRGGWTYTDAVVQHSFASGCSPTRPSIRRFPTIPIGAFSPLVGARPFRVAPNTGYFSVDWNAGRCSLRMTGTMVSRRDDSTFLYDQNYGNTMLLPNRNLDPSYQRLDLYGSFRISQAGERLCASMENLLNQHYYEVFGYPALPFTIPLRNAIQTWRRKLETAITTRPRPKTLSDPCRFRHCCCWWRSSSRPEWVR